MENSKKLAHRFEEVLLSGKWIAQTNYALVLEDVNWRQATTKIASLNTIAALTYHINYYTEGLNHFFKTGRLEISDQYSFELPPIQNEKDWKSLKNKLLKNSKTFSNHVKAMKNDKLDMIFLDKKYGDFRRNIEGVIEHSYYHLGQIVLLKKLIG